MMKMKTITSKHIGCVIDASNDSATSLNLQTIALAREYGAKLGRLPAKKSDDYDQILSEMADSAVDHLNGLELPAYCSFFFEDNCLFFAPSIDNAKEDVGFVSRDEVDETTNPEDSSYPCADYRGEWLHVSDHGNVTLYVREDVEGASYFDREIWGVV